MEELRKPASEDEADILYGAIKALGNVRGDFVNFITPTRLAAPWKPDDFPDFSAVSDYYTVRREPVGWWRAEPGVHYGVLRVTKGKDPVMLICPALERIVDQNPT